MKKPAVRKGPGGGRGKTVGKTGYGRNAALWWKRSLGTSTLTLRATLMNLTDAQREYVRGYPLPGRTWMLNALRAAR